METDEIMSISDRLAHAYGEFRKFRILHPRLLRIGEEIDTLRRFGRQARKEWEASGRNGARPPQKFLPIIGPSGTGKSTSINHYIETAASLERYVPDARPFLHITLSAKATTKTLASDILEAYQDPDFERGTATRLLRRVSNHIDVARTEAMALDEIHHLINSDNAMNARGGGKTAWSVTETIKRMLIHGACPFILLGTEQATPLLLKNPQFKQRSYAPIILGPLDVSIPDEREMFLDHCAGFDMKLVEHGIFTTLSGLVAGDVPACVYEVSQGIIGTASNLFETATVLALRRGDDAVCRNDLSDAVRTWAIPLGIIDHNPFELGPRRFRTGKGA